MLYINARADESPTSSIGDQMSELDTQSFYVGCLSHIKPSPHFGITLYIHVCSKVVQTFSKVVGGRYKGV